MEPDDVAALRSQLDGLLSGAAAALHTGAASDAEPLTLALYGPYHEAAAVLSRFDPSRLAPTPTAVSAEEHADDDLDADPDADLAGVIADSERSVDPTGREHRTLNDDVRREVLAQLGTRERIRAALAANPDTTAHDPVAQMLMAYLDGTAPPVTSQDTDQVAATMELSQWLDGLDLGLDDMLPGPDDVRARREMLALLQPFEELAGAHFAGRTEELQKLRDYVGVLPPGSVRERLSRAAREVFNLHQKPPLFIHGPGGVGKSALVGRFIWEHVTLPHAERFPFVYLDFDRSGLRADEPLTLLVEAVRQLGLEFDNHREFADRLRREWKDELRGRTRALLASRAAGAPSPLGRAVSPQAASGPADWERYLRDFASLLEHVRVGSDPLLFVLDTFEEVQYRGDVVTAALARFLQMFQQHVPRLRIVISGRAGVDLPGVPAEMLPLSDFDAAAAEAYLLARGVEPPALARSIVRRFGGSPLTLWLAAEAWHQTPEEGDLRDIGTRTAFGRRLADHLIQGHLYRRMLHHVHEERVRKLAHPGLVLRRVTPDLIRHVLAGPCEVEVPDDRTADDLFDAMAREVSLLRVDGTGRDRALMHRRDVRRVMIRLLRASEPDKVRLIEEGTVDWYRSSQRPIERAEEIYHRLSLGQSLDTVARRWMAGVEPHLFSALEEGELEAPERAWLASRLGRPLSAEERSAADQGTWERDTRRRVTELLAGGDVDAALRALTVREQRAPGSPLFALEASALLTKGRLDEARDVVQRGVESLEDRADPDASLDLMIRAAVLQLRLGDPGAARTTIRRAGRLLDPDRDRLRWLELGLTEMAADVAEGDDPVVTGRVAELVERFALVSDDELRRQQLTALAAGAELGQHATAVLSRVLAATGIVARRRAPLRQLARALARWDAEVSRAADQWQGALGGARLPWAESLTLSWTRYVLESTPTALGKEVSSLLADREPHPDVVEALIGILRERIGAVPAEAAGDDRSAAESLAASGSILAGETEVAAFGSSAGYHDVNLRLTREQLSQVRGGLVEAFRNRNALARMVRHRLGRSLDSIAPTDDLVEAVTLLLEQSQRQGWTAALLAAALESTPDSAALHAVAEQLGLTAAIPQVPLLAQRVEAAGGSIDVDGWRGRLGVLEAQVCRVEIRSSGVDRYGTAFLLGPDLVLTAHHVVEPVVDGRLGPESLLLRFDYKVLADGSTVTAGTVFGLKPRDWLVDHSPHPGDLTPGGRTSSEESLNYALLRVAGMPGAEPIGGDRAEPDARPRGWIPVPTRPYDFVPGSPLYLLHHPDAGTLKFSMESGGLLGLSTDGARVRYRSSARPGSSGAPCFGLEWELIAMHEGTDGSGVSRGVPLRLVLEHLDRRGLRDILDVPPV